MKAFEKAWFASEEKWKKRFKLFAYDDKGSLTISDDKSISFKGKKVDSQ